MRDDGDAFAPVHPRKCELRIERKNRRECARAGHDARKFSSGARSCCTGSHSICAGFQQGSKTGLQPVVLTYEVSHLENRAG